MKLGFRKLNTGKVIIMVLFLLYLALLVKVILLKYPFFLIMNLLKHGQETPLIERIKHSNFVPFKTILYYLSGNQSFGIAKENILGNIIAFGPLGFLLPLVFKRLKKIKFIIYTAFILSLMFELIQLFTSIGEFDVDDIMLNVLGAICGYLVYTAFNYLVFKEGK